MPKVKIWLVLTSEYRRGKRKVGEKHLTFSSHWLAFIFSSHLLRPHSTRTVLAQHGWHCKWPMYQCPHQLSLSNKLRASVTLSLDLNQPLQTRLRGGNTDYFSAGLPHQAQGISMHTISCSLPWKLGCPAVRIVSVRCPEVQKMTVWDSRAQRHQTQ